MYGHPDLKEFDVLAFYTPAGIKSLFQNYPDFEQGQTIIAAFGEATAEAAIEAGLRLDIKAPTEKAPSMTMALEQFIKAYNKENKSKWKLFKKYSSAAFLLPQDSVTYFSTLPLLCESEPCI